MVNVYLTPNWRNEYRKFYKQRYGLKVREPEYMRGNPNNMFRRMNQERKRKISHHRYYFSPKQYASTRIQRQYRKYKAAGGRLGKVYAWSLKYPQYLTKSNVDRAAKWTNIWQRTRKSFGWKKRRY